MRNDRRVCVAPWRLEKLFPAFYRTVPCAEENLFFVQARCYALYKRIETSFSLEEMRVAVRFCATQTPRLFQLLEQVAPMTEQILLEEARVTLYIKYFAEPCVKERAIKVLFGKDRQK